jgi:hypothetical protein
MAWQDLPQIERELTDALNSFDWTRSSEIVTGLAWRIRSESDPIEPGPVKRILRRLRRKRQFVQVVELSEVLLSTGAVNESDDRKRKLSLLNVRRQYAQALIDQDYLDRAESMLRDVWRQIQDDPDIPPFDRFEVLGMLGRVDKQRYINPKNPTACNPEFLHRSLDSYLRSYEQDPKENLWHGINAVALLTKAKRDKIEADGPDPGELATTILETLQRKELERDSDLAAWDIATFMEAHIALGDCAKAEQRALEYAGACDADAFEIASTLRQLREVWEVEKLAESDPLRARIIPILEAGLLRRQGGTIDVKPDDARRTFQDNFGMDHMNTIGWYQLGLERCRSVACILKPDGASKGTAWVVDSAEFFPAKPKTKLLLTNAHVVCPEQYQKSLYPDQATVQFELCLGPDKQPVRLKIKRVWGYSTRDDLDACFLELDGTPPGDALPLYGHRMRGDFVPRPRLYIIGYPEGSSLWFSLHDNRMVAANENLLHYRTPTAGGSSGSPVFEPGAWNVVGMHHATSDRMPSLTRPGEIYQANEGITISALRSAAAAMNP